MTKSITSENLKDLTIAEQAEQLQLNLDDDYIVVQDNSLVFANYNMTALEQKIFLIMLSTIKKDDTNLLKTTFRVRDIAGLLGIAPEPLYRDLPKMCKVIIKKDVEIKQPNGDWEIFSIISGAKYKSRQGLLTLTLNPQAEPYLLQLKDLFTSFKLRNALTLEGKYAIRLYQLSKSSLYLKGFTIELEDLKKKLKLEQKSYSRFTNINTKILKPAIKEINSKTDIIVDMEFIKSGRNVVAIKFNVKKSDKNNYQKVVYTKPLSKSSLKNGGFNNFEPRPLEERYEELRNKVLCGQATEEERTEFDTMKEQGIGIG
jgi:plasmid replication initiation protein